MPRNTETKSETGVQSITRQDTPDTQSQPQSRPAFISEHVENVDESAANEVGAEDVQRQTDEAEEKGYIGVPVDKLPNEAYSLEGGPPTAPTHQNLDAQQQQ